ncbi:MAG: chitobiase/beta-hexosaminidase C-terminal domain-containing protein [Gaiellaceae bacterium]
MNRISIHRGFGRTARRRRRLLPALAAAIALCALCAGVGEAAIVNPPAGGHGVLVFPVRDFVTGTGYNPGQKVEVDVARNGVVIGTSNATADSTGTVQVNHPGGDCWLNTTPDIMAGDVVQILTDPAAPVGDATTTANVVVTQPATDVGGAVVVKGTAQDAAGKPLPIGELEQRMISKTLFAVNGRRDLRAPTDGTLSYDAAGSINWTATYTGLSSADVALATAAESRMIWLGPTPLLVNQSTLYEFGQVGGPAAPCTSPLASTGITSVSRTVVNSGNVATPIIVSGVAQTAAITVAVSTPAGVATAPVFAPGPAGTETWTATIPAAQLAALPQGSFAVTATFGGLGAPVPDVRTLTKDTIAPPAPTATPAAGTFPGAQAVTLSDADQTARVHYTVDGSVPTAASPVFAGQLQISSSQTIQAVAVDPAGNAGPVTSFAFSIVPPPPPAPVAPVIVVAPASAPPAALPPAAAPTAASTPPAAVPPATQPAAQTQAPAGPTHAKKLVLSLAFGHAGSLHAHRSGKVATVSTRITLDQAATLAVSARDPKAHKQLALLRGTRVGGTIGRGTIVRFTVTRGGIVRLKLRIASSRLKKGRSYLMVVNGRTASGIGSKLTIPFIG